MALETRFSLSLTMGNVTLFRFMGLYKTTTGVNSFLPSTCRGFKIKDGIQFEAAWRGSSEKEQSQHSLEFKEEV